MHILPPLTPLRVSLQNVLLVLFSCICRILMLASNQCFITSLLPLKLLSNIPAAFQVSSCGLHFIHLYLLYFTSLTLTSLATFFFLTSFPLVVLSLLLLYTFLLSLASS